MFTSPRSQLSLREAMTGIQGRSLEVETKAETREELCL